MNSEGPKPYTQTISHFLHDVKRPHSLENDINTASKMRIGDRKRLPRVTYENLLTVDERTCQGAKLNSDPLPHGNTMHPLTAAFGCRPRPV